MPFVAGIDSVVWTAITPDPASLGNFSSKLATLSDVFTLFRVRRMRLTPNGQVQCGLGDFAGSLIMGYTPEVTTNATPTFGEVADMPFTTMTHRFASLVDAGPPVRTSFTHHPTNQVTYDIPTRTSDTTMTRWFRTRTSAAYDDNLEFQGLLYCGVRMEGAVTATVYVHYTLDIEIEFKGFVPLGITPKRTVDPDDDWKEDHEAESNSGRGGLTKTIPRPVLESQTGGMRR
jgi:hypothetical protein